MRCDRRQLGGSNLVIYRAASGTDVLHQPRRRRMAAQSERSQPIGCAVELEANNCVNEMAVIARELDTNPGESTSGVPLVLLDYPIEVREAPADLE